MEKHVTHVSQNGPEADVSSTIDTYRGPRHDGEYERLRIQHDMIKTLMGGKLVLAPVDLSKPNLAVLDSATADGYWLQDLANYVAPTARLLGADIAPQHFLRQSELPENVSLINHNIFDTWPEDCQKAFDLVHQRFVLPVCSDETSLEVIRKLSACVKPGGYLMLHDADFDTIEEGEGHEAMERLRDVLRKSWSMLGYNLSPGPKLKKWFEEVGLESIEEEILHVKVGAAAQNQEIGAKPIAVLLAALDGIEMNLGKMPGFFFSTDDFMKLKKDLKKELETNGNSYKTHVVWARNPYQLFPQETNSILDSVPLIDGHNDWPHLIRGYYDNHLDERFSKEKDLAGHVDVKRLRSGKCGGIFLSAYVDCPDPKNDFSDDIHFEPMRDTLQQIDLIHRLVDLNSDDLSMVKKSSDIMSIFQSGKIACIISIEGLHQIGNSSSVLRNYHRLGVRCATLAHNRNNKYATSANAPTVHDGLSDDGRAIVHEMNRIGMMIDLSHVSYKVMHDVLDISDAPVVFTHSSCSTIIASPRNVPDDVLDRLKINRGIIMISLIPILTHSDARIASVEHVVDHILHAADRIGFDHIGIGSDFDGMENGVIGVEEVSKLPNLVSCMLSRNISRTDIEKILGKNIIRVFEDVEKRCTDLNGEPVLEDKVKQLWNDDFRAWVRGKYPDAERDRKY